VPDIGYAYFGVLAAHVIEAADRLGFHVAVEQTGTAAEDELDAIARSHRLHLDGLILSAVHIGPRDPRLADRDYPIVMLGEQDFSASFDHVVMANEDGARAATEHLVDRGCRRIAIVTGDDFDRVNAVTRRHYGYLSALQDRGIGEDPELFIPIAHFSLEEGRRAAHRIADAGLGVDGVVAVTDTVAQGLLRGFADRGVRVPEDVRLIGFDDIPEARFTVPSLSTVAPDHQWMAEQAVKLIAARIDQPSRPTDEYVAPFAIIERESTR
jgi:DNA-binding LacI/PurR family transcriptional regulator